ncbi:MAG: ribonuclease HII [Chitinophagia bacterium]|nr:ribonuclease HII [Chitinophagia bacterium]
MLAAYYKKNEIEAGCDEAGRGCYAGPVVAAAVILPKNFKHPLLNDSKKLSAMQREMLRPIIEQHAIAWSIGVIDHEEIDKINILKASFKAMHQAIATLGTTPTLLLIDGNRFSAYPSIRHQCFVKGDGRFASIAAASILAKTYRDQLMQKLHLEFPQYGWNKNMGYGTAAHRKAIDIHGLCKYHRKSFRLLPEQGPTLY